MTQDISRHRNAAAHSENLPGTFCYLSLQFAPIIDLRLCEDSQIVNPKYETACLEDY